MKKISKSLFVLLLTFVLAFGTLACGRNPGDPINSGAGGPVIINPDKTQLYIGVYDGGYGIEFAEKWGERFAALNEETSFEEGKKGVQIWINPSELNGPALIDSVLGAREQVFIAQSVYYYDYLSSGVMLDISDVVTESLSEFGENNTIENKLLKFYFLLLLFQTFQFLPTSLHLNLGDLNIRPKYL